MHSMLLSTHTPVKQHSTPISQYTLDHLLKPRIEHVYHTYLLLNFNVLRKIKNAHTVPHQKQEMLH